MLDLVHLPAAQFGSRFPAALSGGQQQRIGLARALAADPDLLLMDEPFGALDAIERTRLQGEMIGLQRQVHKTVLFVTHDVDEALRLADRIVVMRSGRVLQHGSPLEIMARPADPFVAELVNAGDLMRLLALMRVADVSLLPRASALTPDTPTIEARGDLRAALSRMVEAGASQLTVVDQAGNATGLLTLEDMLKAAHALRGSGVS